MICERPPSCPLHVACRRWNPSVGCRIKQSDEFCAHCSIDTCPPSAAGDCPCEAGIAAARVGQAAIVEPEDHEPQGCACDACDDGELSAEKRHSEGLGRALTAALERVYAAERERQTAAEECERLRASGAGREPSHEVRAGDGILDEVVGYGPYHLEQMSGDCWDLHLGDAHLTAIRLVIVDGLPGLRIDETEPEDLRQHADLPAPENLPADYLRSYTLCGLRLVEEISDAIDRITGGKP